jgi:hypothetical protein
MAEGNVDDKLPAKTAGDYGLKPGNEVDANVMDAWNKVQGPEPKREPLKDRVKAITSTEYSKRPSNPKWTFDMAKVGVGGKNFYWSDTGWGTNVPDPTNPGLKADSQEGLVLCSAGQGIENDVNVSQQLHKEEVFNPRLRFQGTNVVNHFSPVIRRPSRWTTKLIQGIARPILAVMAALKEEENA